MSARFHGALMPISIVALVGVAITAVWLNLSVSSGGQEHPSPEQLIQALELELPDNQADLIADGLLSPEEYEGAIERTAQCLEAAGLSVTRRHNEGVGGSTHLDVVGDLRETSQEAVRSAHKGCVETHQGKLGIIWAEMNRPTEAQLNAEKNAFDRCMEAAGFADVLPQVQAMLSDPVSGPFPHGSPEWDGFWKCHFEVEGRYR